MWQAGFVINVENLYDEPQYWFCNQRLLKKCLIVAAGPVGACVNINQNVVPRVFHRMRSKSMNHLLFLFAIRKTTRAFTCLFILHYFHALEHVPDIFSMNSHTYTLLDGK